MRKKTNKQTKKQNKISASRTAFQDSFKHLRWSTLGKLLTAFWRSLFSLNSPSQPCHLRSLTGFWICLLHYYVSYYYVAIFTANIVFIAASFISHCLLSSFHIRLIKINSLFSKLLFFLLCLALFFNWDLLHAKLNSHYKAWSYKKKKHKKIKVYRKSF